MCLNLYSSMLRILWLAIGEKMVLRIPSRRSKMVREREMLSRLGDLVPVPEVPGSWDGDDQVQGAILLSYIKSVPLCGPVNEDMAFQLGRLLARVGTTT